MTDPSSRSDGPPRLWAPDLALVESEPHGFRLRQELVVRLATLTLLMVVAGAVVAYLVASFGTTVHGARVEFVYHLEGDQSADFLRTDRQHTTQLVLIGSRAVLAPVARTAGLSYEELARKVDASMVADSEVIRIQVDDRSEDRARTLATAVGTQYLEQAHTGTGVDQAAVLDDQIDSIDAQREGLEETADRLQQERAVQAFKDGEVPPPSERERKLEAEIDRLLQRRDELTAQQSSLTARQLTAPTIERVGAPYVLPDPVSPRPKRAAVFGACAAFAVALVLVAFVVRTQARQAAGA